MSGSIRRSYIVSKLKKNFGSCGDIHKPEASFYNQHNKSGEIQNKNENMLWKDEDQDKVFERLENKIKLTLEGSEIEKALKRLKLLKKYLNCQNNVVSNLVRNLMTKELNNRTSIKCSVINKSSSNLKVSFYKNKTVELYLSIVY